MGDPGWTEGVSHRGGDRGPGWYRDWRAGWVRAQRRLGRSSSTIRTWGTYIADFGAFLEGEMVNGAAQLTRDHLHRWQDGLSVRLRPASQHVAVTAVRSLLRWADREELSPRPGLWNWLDAPQVPDSVPRALEPAELATIMAHYALPTRDLQRLRDRALFWHLVTTGARISEALQVDVAQLQGRMVIRQKGGREHSLVMSERARQWVVEYLQRRGRDQEPALWIQLGPRGRHRLRADQANAIWRALAEQLRLPPFTSHALKHTGVTELGDHDATDNDIVQHVGWRSSAMMIRYRKLRDRRRQMIVDRLDDLVPPVPPPPAPRRRLRRPA